MTEQNVENYAVFCRQKDNRTCERALNKNATLPIVKGEVAVAVPPLFVALRVQNNLVGL